MSSHGICDNLSSDASPSALDVERQRRRQLDEIVAFRRLLRKPDEAAYSFPEVKKPDPIRWVPIFA